jgi:glutamyl-tRNA synthetase
VRFEDIDGPRVVAGAQEAQLADMKALGLVPDRLLLQSDAAERHAGLFGRARHEGRVYPCFCSRKEVQEALAGAASAPHAPVPLYSGQCRGGATGEVSPRALSKEIGWRFRADDLSGKRDFLVGRAAPDGSGFSPSYHWACAIDDHDGRHRLLVRASDLADAVEPQRAIHRYIGAEPFPAVFHAALVTREDGGRLEKRTKGVTLAELAAAGVQPQELAARFAKSFALDRGAFAPGRVFGEPRERLTLSELRL